MSLTDMVFGEQKPRHPKVLKADAYDWRRLQPSASVIRGLYEQHGATYTSVTFDRAPKERVARNEPHTLDDLLYHYGDSVQQFAECWQFPDGVVLVSVVMSTFEGTFASHPGTDVVYYIATPKEAK